MKCFAVSSLTHLCSYEIFVCWSMTNISSLHVGLHLGICSSNCVAHTSVLNYACYNPDCDVNGVVSYLHIIQLP